MRIAVLASGGGSNLQSLIDAVETGNIKGEIVLVVSDNPDAFALKRAEKHGITSAVVNRRKFSSPLDFNLEIVRVLQSEAADLAVLAGFLPILHPVLVEAFPDRIINIHPSLIPSFCGKGFYGIRVHRAVLDYGVKISGATVHLVDEGTDTGSILLQEAVAVMDDDTPESLAARVLEAEHRILPKAVKLFCENRFEKNGRRISVKGDIS